MHSVDGRAGKGLLRDEEFGVDGRRHLGARVRFVHHVVAGEDESRVCHGDGERWLRKGRFDEIFFVDLPSPSERKTIIEIHIIKKNRKVADFDIPRIVAATQGFSGSEIEQAIVSALFDAFEAKKDIDTDSVVRSCNEIIPLSYQMKERIDYMRDWAKSRARRASLDEEGNDGEDKQIRHLEM